MLDKDNIVKLLVEELNSVYCYNCRGNDEADMREELCEDCYRKYMNWSISRITAERIANKIVGD